PGAECRHNLNYWRYGDYGGVGPGAHGRLNVDGKRLATICERLPERWQEKVRRDGHGLAERVEISAADAAREHLLMGLRLTEGIDLESFRARWSTAPDAARIASLIGDGFLVQTGTHLAATPKGRLVLNRLIAEVAP
ncbi:MAG: coproporphyrinogen III oxidase, partial [Pseudomonadota bacterium]|nr:coproporphyrinogen III oxidase [Pseudomonadota bacterium]